ncbi:MAG: hypothetical protein BWX50_01434 [Euryarchaeota archaeon ADurb.Bin009]|nr:MAG: hypothetical protein BWX50_01606 [Euryarchaeota archaeon ADurb.Bin009]OQC66415.1 MAG: hypothetical protein BWX50_01434 [Euryarchaeota archaeon ADurb.Bin009]
MRDLADTDDPDGVPVPSPAGPGSGSEGADEGEELGKRHLVAREEPGEFFEFREGSREPGKVAGLVV